MKHLRSLLTGCVLVVSLCANAVAQMAGHAPPVPMTPAQFAAASIGQNVQIAVRVDTVKRSTVLANLLAHETDSLSKDTRERVTLYLPSDAPVIMGTASDVVPGAVLYVFGVLTKPGNVDVKQLVIDTKYMKVE